MNGGNGLDALEDLSEERSWRIWQRGEDDTATIEVRGRIPPGLAGSELESQLRCRLVSEETGAPVSPELDRVPLVMGASGTWSAKLDAVPAGGFYRLETSLHMLDGFLNVHFLGVGDLWIIAGQSNAGGFSAGVIDDPPELGVHSFTRSGGWQLAAHPLGNGWGHSPWMVFGRELRRALGVPIGLIPLAIGGSPLRLWDPFEAESPYYARMLRAVRACGGAVRGMVWYQGCSDTETLESAESYADRFCRFVGKLREDLGAPELPVVTAQLNRYTLVTEPDRHRRWSMVRECQRQAARRLDRVAIVPTVDLPVSDGIHTSVSGNATLGARMARAALALAHGRHGGFEPPEVASARRAGSREVLVELARMGEMICLHAPVRDMVVEDGDGFIPIERSEAQGPGRVLLVLARAPVREAVIHAAFGADPVVSLLRGRDQMPLLGCYGVPIN